MSRIELARRAIALPAAWLLVMFSVPQAAWATEPAPHRGTANSAAAPPTPATLAQFQQAAEIARLAAEHGMHELSRRAMREALTNGPPLNLQAMSGLGRPTPRVRVSRGREPGADAPFKVESEVTQALGLLVERWKRDTPAEDVYQTLAEIVLPDRRPRDIFLYDVPPAEPAPPRVSRRRGGFATPGFAPGIAPPVAVVEWPVVAKLLVESAAEAGRTDDLKQKIAAHAGERHTEFAASILLAQLAMADRQDLASLWPQLERLAKHDPPTYAARLLREIAARVDGAELPAAMAGWLDDRLTADAAQTQIIADDETRMKLLVALARWQFANQHAERARKHLDRFAQMPMAADPATASADAHRTTRWLTVVREFCRAGLLGDALDALAKHVDAADGSRGMALTACWLKVRQLLLDNLDALARYERLAAWTMPAGDCRKLRFVGCFVPHDHRPAVFQTALYRSWPDDEIASNFDLLVSAAREAGRLDDLRQRLAPYSTDDSIEAVALEVVVAREFGRADGAGPRVERWLAAQQAALAEPVPTGQELSLAAYLLARACLREEPLRDLGRGLTVLWSRSSAARRNRELLAHLQFELAAAAARDCHVDPQTLAGIGFAHWHTVPSGQNWMMPLPMVPWWVEHEGSLRCLSGKGKSALVFDYPLRGSGEVSVDLLTRGAWGSFTYRGVLIGTHGLAYQDGTFPAMAVEKLFTPAETAGVQPDVNRWTLRVEPSNVKIHVINNGDLAYDIFDPNAAAPWLALCSWSPAEAAFRRLSLSGDWWIPRQVSLVQGDHLVGWTGGFYDDPQVAQQIARGPRSRRIAPTRRGTATNGPQVVPPAAFRTASSQAANRGWYANEGNLFAAVVRTPEEAAPQPSRLTYFRPLRNGEVLRYEFIYHPGPNPPGQNMVHPALDRLTFLLEPEGVRLHWMTDHPDAEAGDLALDNVADDPAARRGPPRLPLVAGDWNRVALSLAGDEIIIELNGVMIYQRKLESANDRLFSFFRYQNQTAANVREVVLSGDWPERVPRSDEILARSREPSDAEREALAKLVAAEQFESKQGQVEEKKQ